MQEVMIGFQFTALIPILVILYYKPALNGFFKLLLATILLSIISDIFGTILYLYKNNMPVYFPYCFINVLLITLMWQKIPFYHSRAKRFVLITGIVIFVTMMAISYYFKFTEEAFYLISSSSVSLALILALHFYYQKLALSSYTSPLNDPYFFTASGYILFSLSTIIILAAQVNMEPSFAKYAWVLRQFFYFIYNVILGYAFYILHKSQVVRR